MQTKVVRDALRTLGFEHGEILPIDEGWSSWVFDVEPGWIFRFPRNEPAATALSKEISVLPLIASRVEFAVPVFEHIGSFNGKPFVGYRRIPGHALVPNDLTDEGVKSVAEALSSLHQIPVSLLSVSCGVEPGVDAWRRRYVLLLAKARKDVYPHIESDIADAVERGFKRFLTEELATLKDASAIHYDLGPEHILMDGTVNGLIDFEDVTVGDPTVDFVGLFISCGEAATQKIRDRYCGSSDVNFEARLRFYTWMGAYHQVAYGLERGDGEIIADGVRGLKNRLSAAGLM